MFTSAMIDEHVYRILAEVSQEAYLQAGGQLDLSSIQILKALSLVEKTFQIEIEDEDVFHGLFSSAGHLSQYIQTQLKGGSTVERP